MRKRLASCRSAANCTTYVATSSSSPVLIGINNDTQAASAGTMLHAPFDVILTDINMGHMDGYEFIRRVRAEPQYEDLPIIIISTEAAKTDKMRGFEAGANLYIVKPAEPAVMIENIRLVLSGQ